MPQMAPYNWLLMFLLFNFLFLFLTSLLHFSNLKKLNILKTNKNLIKKYTLKW